MDKFEYIHRFGYNDQPNYTKVHVVSSNKLWHIYWNLFRKPYTRWGIKFYSSIKALSFYFGKGEFVISIRENAIK